MSAILHSSSLALSTLSSNIQTLQTLKFLQRVCMRHLWHFNRLICKITITIYAKGLHCMSWIVEAESRADGRVDGNNNISSHMPELLKAEATERKAPINSEDQFVSKAPHGLSLGETDTVHVFVVRPLSTVDIMFNWKYV